MTATRHTFPLDKLSPADFERLCHWLVVREPGYGNVEYLGEAGSDGGRDVQAWREGRRVVFQCKRVRKFGLAGAKVEIAKLTTSPAVRPDELVFVVAKAVRAGLRRQIQDAWGDTATCHFWASAEIDEKLKRHPDAEREFFGEPRAFLHNLPFLSLGDLFKGRERELAELERVLASDASATLEQASAPALHGLGGVGKTRLAVEYALRHQAEFRSIFFVRASSPLDLERGLAGLADLLELGLPADLPEKEKAERVVRELRKFGGWLLILDNVDTLEAQQAARALLLLGSGRLLITSRLQVWPTGTRQIGVETLEPAAAVAFLLEATENGRARAADDAAQAGLLAERLGYFPLALELTASYLRIRHVAFRDLLVDWDKRLADLTRWHDPATIDYPVPLALAWERTFEHLTFGARALLQLLGHLAPTPIEEAMLEASWEDLAADVPDLATAMAELARYSLISRNPEADRRSFVVHRLVQEVARQHIPEAERSAWVENAVGLVSRFGPEDPQDVGTWQIWDLLRPHASRVLELAEKFGVEGSSVPFLMGQLGVLLQKRAIFNEAERLLRRALELAKATFAADHFAIAVYTNNLANLLLDTNCLEEAEPLMRRALTIDEACFGHDHPNVARDLNNLANLLLDTNCLEEAEPLMRRALAINEASFGDNHLGVARVLNNLALLLKATNRLAEAELLMRRALTIDEACFGDIARDLNNLANLLKVTNRLGEAEPLMRRALAIDEARFGDNHPYVARDLANLADMFKSTNRLADAEPLMRRALAIDETSFGVDHPRVALQLNMALLLQSTNRLAEAMPLMLRAVSIFERSVTPGHPHIEIARGNLARLLQALGRESEI